MQVNDLYSYQPHGICKVNKLTPDKVVFEILDSKLIIMIQRDQLDQLNIRSLISKKDAISQLKFIKTGSVPYKEMTWNNRYRELMELINTGGFTSIVSAYKILMRVRASRDLSFGERKMLEQAKSLIEQEISAVLGKETILEAA